MEAAACTSGRLGAAPALAHRCQRPSAQAALATARQLRRSRRGAQQVVASMGLGFHVGQPTPSGLVAPQEPQLLLPEHDYGLSVKQMQVLGLTNEATGFGARLPEVKAVSAAAAAAVAAHPGCGCVAVLCWSLQHVCDRGSLPQRCGYGWRLC